MDAFVCIVEPRQGKEEKMPQSDPLLVVESNKNDDNVARDRRICEVPSSYRNRHTVGPCF